MNIHFNPDITLPVLFPMYIFGSTVGADGLVYCQTTMLPSCLHIPSDAAAIDVKEKVLSARKNIELKLDTVWVGEVLMVYAVSFHSPTIDTPKSKSNILSPPVSLKATILFEQFPYFRYSNRKNKEDFGFGIK
jgi:hypothetical protein